MKLIDIDQKAAATLLSFRAYGVYLSLVALAASTHAATLRVPADYPTIQAAVNAAAMAGDEILIAPGVYNEQVVIAQKKLTLTGSPGTVLEAWTGMSWRPGGPSHDLVWITSRADVVIRNIEFDGKRLAASMPKSSALMEGVIFYGASGRVENCVFRGFRGAYNLGTATNPPRGGYGFGLVAFNPLSEGPGVIHVQVLNCDFSDNAFSMTFGGDFGPGPTYDFTLLRTTFTAEGNTVTGVGPTSLDFQIGIDVYHGASGVIKNNVITGHMKTGGGYWSIGLYARPVGDPPAPVKPLLIEANTFVENQKNVVLIRGDDSRIIGNFFDGSINAALSDGIWLSGSNVLTAVNLFTNLNTGVVLAANNWHLPRCGATVDPVVLANRFANVSQHLATDPGIANVDELGTEFWPFLAEGFGNLTCSPQCALPGTIVTLSGTNLNGTLAVLFNGTRAEFTPGTDPDKQIIATVPPHATTGPITVIVPQGNITSLQPFVVPVLLTMTASTGNAVQLCWCADACDMILETTSSLVNPDWQPVATSPSVGTDLVTWTAPLAPAGQFFRLRQP